MKKLLLSTLISTCLFNYAYAGTNITGNKNEANNGYNNILGDANKVSSSFSNLVGAGNINYSNRVSILGNNNIISAENVTPATFDGQGDSTTVGGVVNAQFSARDSSVIGSNNTLYSVENNILGNKNYNKSPFSNLVGNHNQINSSQSQVFGNGITTTENANNSITIGGGTIQYDSATRANSIVNGTTNNGQFSTSIGYGNTLNSNNTVILGSNVTSNGDNNVLLGNNSSDSSDTTTNGVANKVVNSATVGTITYSGFSGSTANGIVSVGSTGNERRITNVAAAEITKNSTDAINGSQLYMVANEISNQAVTINNHTNEITDLKNQNVIINGNIQNLNTAVNNNTNAINDLNTKTDQINNQVNVNKDDISNLKNQTSSLTILANDNKTRLDNINNSTINVQNVINQHGKLISDLQLNMNNINHKVHNLDKKMRGIGAQALPFHKFIYQVNLC